MKKLLTIIFLCINTIAFAQSGITWQTGLNIANNTHGNMHPRMAIDGTGNPIIIWGRMSDASVFFSKWNGSVFSAPMKLNPSWMTVATTSWMGPDIASKGDTVYVVMKQTPEADTASHIYIMTSFDGGNTFYAPVQIDLITDSISRFPTVTIDDSGNPIVAFMKFNPTFGDARWVVAKSNDFGNTFSFDVKASGWSSMTSTVCDCCPGAIVSSGNVSAVLYRDNNSNIRDSWAGISTNNSSSYNYGFAIDNNNWFLNSCPSTGPDGVIIGDSLYTVFMNGASGMSKSYLSSSSISNAALNSVIPLTGNIPGLNQQNFPRIASDGTAMAIVWKQNVNGSDQLPLLFTNNIANGFPAASDTVDLNDITNADIALTDGNIFIVWEDDNSGTVKFRWGTYNSISASVNEIEQNNFSVYPNPASDVMNITTTVNEKFSVTIFNSMGELIYAADKIADCQLPIANWNKGLYLIEIKSDKYCLVKKVMIVN